MTTVPGRRWPAPPRGPSAPQRFEREDRSQSVFGPGRLHAYGALEARRTALVVIDMTVASAEADPACLGIMPQINSVAAALRERGGIVCWIVPAPLDHVPDGLVAVFGADRARHFADVSRPGDRRSSLCAGLDVADEDLHFTKVASSAFFPGNCGLHDALAAAEVDAVLVAGTVTNICCESSARDAVELGYKVTMISDANAGHAHGLHEATLNTFYRAFGDVRTAADVLDLICHLS